MVVKGGDSSEKIVLADSNHALTANSLCIMPMSIKSNQKEEKSARDETITNKDAEYIQIMPRKYDDALYIYIIFTATAHFS